MPLIHAAGDQEPHPKTIANSPPPNAARQSILNANAEVAPAIQLQLLSEASSAKDEQNAADARQEALRQYLHGPRLYLVALALTLVLLLGGLDGNIVATAVPAITNHFHTVSQVGWYYSAYRISSCVTQFPFGKLYSIYPAKRLFTISNSVFLLGSILCAAATTSAMFVAGRAITGVGVAGSAAGFFALVMDVTPPQKRPLLTAMFGAVESVASLVAPVLGGVITQELSWRWCFWINVPITGVSLVVMAFLLPEVNRQSDCNHASRAFWDLLIELDVFGVSLLTSSLVALFIALNWAGGVYAWNSIPIITLLPCCAVLMVCFIVQQYHRGDTGILPGRLIKDRNVQAGFIFAICSASSLSLLEYYAPTFFQEVHGYSPARSGYMMFPCLVGTLLGFLLQGSGTSLFGYYAPFMIASSILMPVATGLLTLWDPSTSIVKLVVYFAIAGLGAGVGILCPQNAIQTALSRKDVPLGTALILFAQNFGPALFVSVGQTIFTSRLTVNLRDSLSPGVEVGGIQHMGITDIKNAFSGQEANRVVIAFSESISETWYLALGLTCFSIVGSLLMPWLSVKKKEE